MLACRPARQRSRSLASLRVRASDSSSSSSSIDWESKAKARLVRELAEAGQRQGVSAAEIEQGLDTLAVLLPGFSVDLEALKASTWVEVVRSPRLVAAKVIALKAAFPSLDVALVLSRYPRALAQDLKQLERNVSTVAELLADAEDAAAILHVIPQCLNAEACVQVLVTMQRWFPQKDPIKLLQDDPDIINRAQQNDVPLEPVFFDAEQGTFAAPQNSRQVTQPWQAFIREKVYKQKVVQPLPKVPKGGVLGE